MRCVIEVVSGIYDGLIYEFETFPFQIGRDPNSSQVALSLESSVSRNHAEVSYSEGSIFIKDQTSSNGTFVNGQRIGGTISTRSLNDGDIVRVGDAMMKISISR